MKKINLNNDSGSINIDILHQIIECNENDLLVFYSDGTNFCTGLDLKTKNDIQEKYLDIYIKNNLLVLLMRKVAFLSNR